jgi:hypothetical protein
MLSNEEEKKHMVENINYNSEIVNCIEVIGLTLD